MHEYALFGFICGSATRPQEYSGQPFIILSRSRWQSSPSTKQSAAMVLRVCHVEAVGSSFNKFSWSSRFAHLMVNFGGAALDYAGSLVPLNRCDRFVNRTAEAFMSVPIKRQFR